MYQNVIQNVSIRVAAQCAVNTGKTEGCEMDRCIGDYEAVTSEKEYLIYFDFVVTLEFIQNI